MPAAREVPSDRRTEIADAALVVLAEEGAKGLTHRAVDHQLGLADGSTSYYFRTSAALLEAAEARLFVLDSIDLSRSTPDVDGVIELVNRWLAPRNRTRLVARFELMLADARAERRGPMAESRRQFSSAIDLLMADLGARDPKTARITLLAAIEGLLVDGLTGPSASAASRRMIVEAAMDRALDG